MFVDKWAPESVNMVTIDRVTFQKHTHLSRLLIKRPMFVSPNNKPTLLNIRRPATELLKRPTRAEDTVNVLPKKGDIKSQLYSIVKKFHTLELQLPPVMLISFNLAELSKWRRSDVMMLAIG